MKFKVVVTDYVFPSLDVEKSELANIGAELFVCSATDEVTLAEETKDADAVLVCYAELTKKVISSMEKCKIISRYGIGVNNIDIPAATKKGIAISYVPDYCIEEVSDHALALLLSAIRKVCQLDATVKQGSWDFKAYRPLHRVKGKTLGLVGLGKIPRRLVEKVKPYGLHVIAYDPYADKVSAQQLNVQLVELDTLLAESDYISIHTPLTPHTEGMFAYPQFRMMKKRPIIVNTAREKIINETDLVQALEENLVSAACLDVMDLRKFSADHPLLANKNVLITPHVAFYSEESLQELQARAVEAVVQVLQGRKPRVCLNPEVFNNPCI